MAHERLPIELWDRIFELLRKPRPARSWGASGVRQDYRQADLARLMRVSVVSCDHLHQAVR